MPTLPSIIPQPASIQPSEGQFRLGPESRILHDGENARIAAEYLAETLRTATGFAIPVTGGNHGETGDICLCLTGSPDADEAGFYPEAYRCEITPGTIRVEASAPAGLARAVQTLRQALPTEIFADRVVQRDWVIQAMRIEDAPRFRWRGLHLDVSRHFFRFEELCRFIDLMALHRFNVCHLHLTDDQGWRVEIGQYPRLTEVGSMRSCTLIGHERDRPRRYDAKSHGGFYSQKQLRALVAYANRRHIALVPEIDMPGHMQAAIAAYPELGNTGGPIEPRCHWAISQHILNVEEDTLRFMENVLDEIMEIFPGRFIHIGGDEAVKFEWSESPRVQARMAERGLSSEAALQSWFIGRMGRHIASRGRRMIGWDEIIEGGLPEGAAVMSWRNENSGIEAARVGHDVVMAPSRRFYFDYYQSEPIAEEPLAIGGMTSTDAVFAHEVIPRNLPEQFHPNIMGAQGQLWSEYIPDMNQLDYMTYPRACALAEVLWTSANSRSRYADFLFRLARHRERLGHLKVEAHPRP